MKPTSTRVRSGVHSRRLALLVAVFVAVPLLCGVAVQQALTAASAATGEGDVTSVVANDELFGARDGEITEGAEPTVFDGSEPAIVNLDPALLAALQDAAVAAAHDGIEFRVNSGWRAPEYQQRLLSEAIAKYGSEQEAARWVATAEKSEHVQGKAVDLGPVDALDWLVMNGADYGLCQIFANEMWHYELRPDAVTDGCPRMFADPTHDTGMTE